MNNGHLEEVVLKNLLLDEEYCREVIPYIKADYFIDLKNKVIFEQLENFVSQYHQMPSADALKIMIIEGSKLDKKTKDSAVQDVYTWSEETAEPNKVFLLNMTEEFCKDMSLYLAIQKAVRIYSGDDKLGTPESIPDLVQAALGVTFDSSIGHDYTRNAEQRFDEMHTIQNRVPFDIPIMNKITKGGLPPGTLTILVSGPGGGKSLAMCHMAASNYLDGKNVLYLSCEMSEEMIGVRIDANILDLSLDTLTSYNFPKKKYMKMMEQIQEKMTNRLLIKGYSPGTLNSNVIRNLLRELAIKQNFIPDIIYLDYLNLCSSSRVKFDGKSTYMYVKYISEEMRAVGIDYQIPIVSATQLTRSGAGASDVEQGDVAESFGTVHTADLILALVTTPELARMGMIMVKQLKNRLADVMVHTKFLVGVDRSKMRWMDAGGMTVDGVDGTVEEEQYDLPVFQDDGAPEVENSIPAGKFSNFKF